MEPESILASATAPDGTIVDRGKLDSAKARRIVAAMRTSIGSRGAAGSTFDQVAGEAGVSRGLLHYYFGSKERLLAEVVRHDSEVRIANLDAGLQAANSVDAIVELLVQALENLVEREPDNYALIFELFTAARHNEELREEMAEVYRRVQNNVARVLEAKQEEGVVSLAASPEAVVATLFGLGDGIALHMLSDPTWDSSETFAVGAQIARRLLSA